MSIRLEFRYRPALVRKMTISAADGAILGGVLAFFFHIVDSIVLSALEGAVVMSGVGNPRQLALLWPLRPHNRRRIDDDPPVPGIDLLFFGRDI